MKLKSRHQRAYTKGTTREPGLLVGPNTRDEQPIS